MGDKVRLPDRKLEWERHGRIPPALPPSPLFRVLAYADFYFRRPKWMDEDEIEPSPRTETTDGHE